MLRLPRIPKGFASEERSGRTRKRPRLSRFTFREMKLPFDKRIAGLLVPVFAIRTEDDLGVGDTEGVKQMVDWCARHGFHVLQLLPINETGEDNSPYNAISAIALDPTTIAISPKHLPDLTQEQFDSIANAQTRAELRKGRVKYRTVKPLKLKLLRAAFESFQKAPANRRDRFQSFCEHSPWLDDYALFRQLMDEHGGNPGWESWPSDHQSPLLAKSWLSAQPRERRQALQEQRRLFEYVQWVAQEQWVDVHKHAESRGVALMGDIPYGVSRHSSDVWANRALFDLQWSGGAPPEKVFKLDEFTMKWGQNWGVPLYRWDEHRKQNFLWWKLRVRQTSEIFHAFRIDHVLGFYRIYAFPWKPEENEQFVRLTPEEAANKTGGLLPRFWPGPDETEKQKKVNCAQGEKILQMIRKAAGETTVIAEDLGVVPDYVPVNLTKLGIPGFKIPHFERNKDYTWKDAASYPRLSIVTPATHDHEPLAGQWRTLWKEHEDAKAKHDHHRAHVSWLELQRFVWWCGWDGNHIPREFTPELHEAYCRRVLESNTWLAVLMITDAFAQTARFNIPGPMAETNWAERIDKPVSQLDQDPALLAKTQMTERLIRAGGRWD